MEYVAWKDGKCFKYLRKTNRIMFKIISLFKWVNIRFHRQCYYWSDAICPYYLCIQQLAHWFQCRSVGKWITLMNMKTLILMILEYSKNPYPLGDRILPNETTTGVQKPWGQRSSGYWGPDGCRVRNYEILVGMGSWFYPMTHVNEGHQVLGNCTIPYSNFSTDLDTGYGINMEYGLFESGRDVNTRVLILVRYLNYLWFCFQCHKWHFVH